MLESITKGMYILTITVSAVPSTSTKDKDNSIAFNFVASLEALKPFSIVGLESSLERLGNDS